MTPQPSTDTTNDDVRVGHGDDPAAAATSGATSGPGSDRDPTHAIAFKKAQAAANRSKIAAAIVALQRDSLPVNVQSVARTAGVHPATLRRNPPLLAEVQRLREQGWQRPPTVHANPGTAAAHQALKARLLASQEEVADLRRQLAKLRRDAHQALGAAGAGPDPTLVEELQRETAELRIQLMNERDTTRSLRDTVRDLGDELTAAREIARGYLRDRDHATDEVHHTRRELLKLRTHLTTGSDPTGSDTPHPDVPPAHPRPPDGVAAGPETAS